MTDRDRCRVESIIGILADQSNDPADRCRWAIEACDRALDRADPEPPTIPGISRETLRQTGPTRLYTGGRWTR